MSRGSKLKALALGALVCTIASPLTAQTVVGGNSAPGVEVNWSVLDRLGPAPSLPGMLLPEIRPTQAMQAAPTAKPGAQGGAPKGVAFKPYKDGGKPAPAAKATAPRKASATAPAPTKAAAQRDRPVVSELAEAPAAPPRVEAKPAKPPVPDMPEIVAVPPKVDNPKERPKSALVAPPAVESRPIPAPEPSKPVQLAPESPKPATPPPQVAKVEPPQVAKVEPPQVAKVEPPPPPAPAPQVASVPSGSGFVRKGDSLSVLFHGENARLPDSAKPELDKVAGRMEKDEGLSLQLLAYAEGDEANASKARRLSLSRALEVRKYLMELGVRSTRIEVRALGNKVEGGPADRVDATFASR